MRRSRIKVMATVPARRKPTKDFKDEKPDLSDSIYNEIVDVGETTENIVSCVEDSKETLVETVNLVTVKQETKIELQRSPDVSQIIDIVEKDGSEELAASCQLTESTNEEISNLREEILLEKPEQTENNVAKSPSWHKTIPKLDNAPPACGETKSSCVLETAPVAKISQTRTSFMRPTPRLDGAGRIRRNSVQGSGASASESEDDCRRATSVMTNRVRNDSVNSINPPKGQARENFVTSVSTNFSSVASVVSVAAAGASPLKTSKSYVPREKRKMNVSESARKLAEARREFLLKYEDKQPDRAKLTMYDLIYYNPVTNPLKKPDEPLSAGQRNTSSVVTAPLDDDEEEEEEECETGEAMPVPQVKVGPDGHLVLDEQSLVIEHTGAKKSRQALARTEALIDENSNGSGFYKKRRKTRDWPKWETLKFYKALNTVGTDFLLMQSLFPQRTRQEIKMKFKKEEKTNRRFVEKALIYYQEFDIDSLKEDLATFEETENRQTELVKSEKLAARQDRGPKRRKNKSRRMVALSIAETNEDLNEPEASVEETSVAVSQSPGTTAIKLEKKKPVKRRQAAAAATSEDWIGSESTVSSNESASDTEIYQIKPTRSGRKPKVRKLQAPTINTLDNLFSDNEHEIERQASTDFSITDKRQDSRLLNYTDEEDDEDEDDEITIDETLRSRSDINADRLQRIENSISDISNVEPGSLVIISRESTDEPGEKVLQVYMVSSEIDDKTGNGTRQNMTPVILTPELLNTVTAGITKVSPINVNTD